MDCKGIQIPDDVRKATAYREFFEIVQAYARVGLPELREVNPIALSKSPEVITSDD